MSDEDRSFFKFLLHVPGRSEREERVYEYMCHRIKAGAKLRDVLHEDYVERNCSREQIDRLIRDPRLIREDREGLRRLFESGEIAPDPSKRGR